MYYRRPPVVKSRSSDFVSSRQWKITEPLSSRRRRLTVCSASSSKPLWSSTDEYILVWREAIEQYTIISYDDESNPRTQTPAKADKVRSMSQDQGRDRDQGDLRTLVGLPCPSLMKLL